MTAGFSDHRSDKAGSLKTCPISSGPKFVRAHSDMAFAMKTWISCIVAVLVGVLIGGAGPLQVLTGRVVGVTDGDTITLLDGSRRTTTIRLAEIDAPESGQPWGKKSKAMLSDLVFGHEVRAEVTGTDRYGRAVARIYRGKIYVNAEMVRRGGAWAFRRYLTDQAFVSFEASAKRGRLGLWAMPPDQTLAPWVWRANRRAQSSTAAVERSSIPQEARVSCGTKRYCRQMSSCAEASAYLRQCGLKELDGDGDGVPCESLCARR
jgi:endonuclease YncB( thermonuclease family)